ncbi:uncharacterized protein ARMOST_22007 [Armillaria ostoyae]|uniref:Uncharacterized protein n=1 Tax=Armillaria ostoyae TaxID=47428 RepID=A0A284SBN3_ARMOS|nr:uncharacterized protein ARMOST_22007 [Armillaria ostoyae]
MVVGGKERDRDVSDVEHEDNMTSTGDVVASDYSKERGTQRQRTDSPMPWTTIQIRNAEFDDSRLVETGKDISSLVFEVLEHLEQTRDGEVAKYSSPHTFTSGHRTYREHVRSELHASHFYELMLKSSECLFDNLLEQPAFDCPLGSDGMTDNYLGDL